jgi:hypothetical protein
MRLWLLSVRVEHPWGSAAGSATKLRSGGDDNRGRLHANDLKNSIEVAKKLRAGGTKLFIFQQGRGGDEQDFKSLAQATGGAFFQFTPTIERVAKRLPRLFEAVTHYAIGGTARLQTRGDESATLLLEQMNPANRITTRWGEKEGRQITMIPALLFSRGISSVARVGKFVEEVAVGRARRFHWSHLARVINNRTMMPITVRGLIEFKGIR